MTGLDALKQHIKWLDNCGIGYLTQQDNIKTIEEELKVLEIIRNKIKIYKCCSYDSHSPGIYYKVYGPELTEKDEENLEKAGITYIKFD